MIAQRRVRVGSRWFVLSAHAIERYCERVKPALEVPQVIAELERLFAATEATSVCPGWAPADGRHTDEWIVIADAIVFPVIGPLIVTCLTRGASGERVRAARARARQDRSEDRGPRGSDRRFKRAQQTKRGGFARDSRRRRRELREGVE